MSVHLHPALLLLLSAGGFYAARLQGRKLSRKLQKRALELQLELATCQLEILTMKQAAAAWNDVSTGSGRLSASELQRPGKTA